MIAARLAPPTIEKAKRTGDLWPNSCHGIRAPQSAAREDAVNAKVHKIDPRSRV
jgi:hypothetical protein